MKNFILGLALVLAFPIGIAIAGGNELAYTRVQELPALTALNVAQSDYLVVFDTSDGKTKKVLASAVDFRAQVASTTTSATLNECGKTFISNSADVITLPEASTALGCRYTFVCGTTDDFDVNPADGTDVIGPVSTTNGSTSVVTLSPSAGDAVRCTDIGGSLTLEAIAADRWAQVGGGNGIWTDVN